MIDPLETDFSRFVASVAFSTSVDLTLFEFRKSSSKPPDKWKNFTHPDGSIYFLNESWQIPVITDVYVDDDDPRRRLEGFIEKIFSYIDTYEVIMPAEACLVLEFRQTGKCGYYFVDHSTRCLFWLEEFDAIDTQDFLVHVRVKFTPPLVGHEMKSLYWLHNEYFPELRPFVVDALQELKDVLIHAVGDSLTSPWSNTPYNLDNLQKMLSLVKDIESSDSRGPGSAVVVYRLLHNFYHERLLNLHGEKGARLNVNQSIHPERKKTFIIKIVSPLLLFGPESHIRKLTEMSVDSLVRRHDWDKLLADLTNDWKEFALYATVLLNANVAFLAIQSVDDESAPGYRSPEQRASYFSVVTSIGAIAIGLLLARHHNTSLDPSFLAYRSASMLGLETLAIMYSLPYALLMWGMASFFAAILITCFDSGDIFTVVMMSLTCFTLSILLLWTVTVVYENAPFWQAWPFRAFRSWKRPDGVLAGEGRLRPSSRSKNL
ncbi:hypothetical protein M413DRAFT_264641 [Hebeloma cylindrosporum]|uniref:Uncharacterized protein n=1 Tax=Hebeloma cylindrosporum TaxID=76867 RepID=A0A0C3CDK9_HEBCY|nr:hypothetical protein M413DRAFT_264641 [Hebeloma cylindrosporum h7]